MPLQNAERRGMDVQFTEPQAEGFVLFRRQILLAKKDHQILEQRRANLGKLLGRQRPREIDAVDFRADRRSQARHRYRFEVHDSLENSINAAQFSTRSRCCLTELGYYPTKSIDFLLINGSGRSSGIT